MGSGPVAGAPRIAIAHDYLTQRGGAERVVLTLAKGFPDAPIYTTLFDPDGTYPEFSALDVRTSRLNDLGIFRRDHRRALPVLAPASSRLRIDADIVIASSSGWAHGFGGEHKTLVYCYSPARWLYQPDVYLSDSASLLTRAALATLKPGLRSWDRRAARRADRYLAISTVVQERILETYGIRSTVVPAPLNPSLTGLPAEEVDAPFVRTGGYLLCVSRLLPYKNVDAVVAAMRHLPRRRLVVVGRGPEREALMAAAPDNVTFLQDLTDGQMRVVYERSAGLVAASHEDFGLTPLEAASFGKPSAVLAAGGFLDTMIEGTTATFFSSPTPREIASAINELCARDWSPDLLRRHADGFGEARFVSAVRDAVESVLEPVTLQG